MRTMKALLLAAAIILPSATVTHAAPGALTVHGVLGQSAVGDAPPLPWTACAGAYADGPTRLWTMCGDRAYCFERDAAGAWACPAANVFSLPNGVRKMKGLGERLIFLSHDDKLYELDLKTRQGKLLTEVHFADGKTPRDFAVGKAGLYALGQDGTVRAWAADGTGGRDLFKLSLPPKADWWYCSIDVEPATGDLLIGSYWPDTKVYRFGVTGKQFPNTGTMSAWPKSGQSDVLCNAAGVPWGLDTGGGGKALASMARGLPKALVGEAWAGYPSGIAVFPSGETWVACAQGLLGFDHKGRPTGKRLGGLADPGLIAAGPDGTVLALLENSQRCARLSADDVPDTPFASYANEPWRVANGWGGKAVGCAWDGKGYLILDAGGSKALWRFDPDHTAFAETPWTRLGKEKAFADPRGLAAGDACCWVLDGPKLLQFGPGAWDGPLQEVTLPPGTDTSAVVTLCSSSDDRLFLATKSGVICVARKGPTWEVAWRSDGAAFQGIAAMCASGGLLLVADRPGTSVTALDEGGKVVSRLGAGDVPGGFEPVDISAAAGWAFVADAKGHRILRVKLP